MYRVLKAFTKSLLLLFVAVITFSCHKTTLEDQAEKMVNDYTERYCPTPVQNMQRTDSIVFDRSTKTFIFYFTLTDKVDDKNVIKQASKDISKTLLNELKEDTNYKVYKEAGYNFSYIFRSQKNKTILFKQRFTVKDYKH